MPVTHTNEPTSLKPLRLWPGVVVVVLQWIVWLVVPLVAHDATMVAVLGGLAGGLAVVVWWLFFSRAPWVERVGAIVLMVVAVVATTRVVHQSLANGMMGMLVPIYARARPGTTRCWSAMSCWCATARRWPRSGCRSRAAEGLS